MEIYKFGGTSVGDSESIKRVANIINSGTRKIVVLSANGKVTDILSGIIEKIGDNNPELIFLFKRLEDFYSALVSELFGTDAFSTVAKEMIIRHINEIKSYAETSLTKADKDFIITLGEIISTKLFSLYLSKLNINHKLIFADELIFLDKSNRPDQTLIRMKINEILTSNPSFNIFITQGFICRDSKGNIATLGRGGSDFTASLLGAAVNASVIQIWSDVDGFLNNDPGFVRGALPLKYLSFDEAAELAYFGARVLHPATIYPAKETGIPVLLKNTRNPEKPGTVISEKKQSGDIKAVASKDGISSITIHSHQMLMAHGFLRKVFEIFEKHETAVDMVTTSEVSVSVTIDNKEKINEILSDLKELGEVNFSDNLSLVCVVGDHLADNKGKVMEIFSALKEISVKMISYGAAKNSIAFLVDENVKTDTLELLNKILNRSTQNNPAYV